ncbi:MAG TPA: methyltransferase domain-containing protein [Solirubrobacteraceae bacterium]|nr:methyltransferase domain-containing protein [Solirubrobacteraceae bacterium]
MSDLAQEVRRLAPWYHTFELPGGVVTDGYFDLRGVVGQLPLPASLEGKRCLDAAACEGFWSFEMARRGAAGVVSLDLPDTSAQDWQGLVSDQVRHSGSGMANDHFAVVRDALGIETVDRVDGNLYDVDPSELGTFDYVFVGNVLIHLADPARALRALRSVIAPGGELLSLEATSLALTLLSPRVPFAQLWDVDDQPRWWTPNKAAHRRLLHTAGYQVLASGGPLFQPFGTLLPRWPRRPRLTMRELIFWGFVRRVGPASAWVRGRPAG